MTSSSSAPGSSAPPSHDLPPTRAANASSLTKATPLTVITREYSQPYTPGTEPYYPVNDQTNNSLYAKYKILADQEPDIIFGGRLAEYQYYNMDQAIASAMRKWGEYLSC